MTDSPRTHDTEASLDGFVYDGFMFHNDGRITHRSDGSEVTAINDLPSHVQKVALAVLSPEELASFPH